jgi:hypothetical protein
MLQLKNIYSVLILLFFFGFNIGEAQDKEDLNPANKESKISIILKKNSAELQYVSIMYTPNTFIKKLSPKRALDEQFFKAIKLSCEKLFVDDNEFIENNNPELKYEKDTSILHTPEQVGDKEIETGKIYVFGMKAPLPSNPLNKEIIGIFIVKKFVRWELVPNPLGGPPVMGSKTNFFWYTLQGTNLKILLDSNTVLKKTLLKVASKSSKEIEEYTLQPDIIPPRAGLYSVVDSASLNRNKEQVNNDPTTQPIEQPTPPDIKWEINPRTNEIKLLSIPSPIKIVQQGDQYTLTFKLQNNTAKELEIKNAIFTSNSNKRWSINTKSLTGAKIPPSDNLKFDVTYQSSPESRGDLTDLNIELVDNSVTPTPVYNGVIKNINSYMDNAKSGLILDLSLMDLSSTLWLPSVWTDANGVLQTSYKWNFSINMGHKEIGYPFWTSANWNIMAGYGNILKLGFSFPGGNILSDDLGPITVPKRKLHGVWGIIAELDLHTFTINENNPFTLGGYFYYGNIKEYSDPPKYINNDYYYIPIVFQVWYPIIFSEKISNPKYIFQTKIGFSYHQVRQVHITQPWEVGTLFNEEHEVLKEDVGKIANWDKVAKISSPYVKVDYINLNGSNKYGFSLQYSNKIASFDSWIEFGSFLRLEGHYAKTFQKAELWENSSVFWISPRFNIPLNF